MFSLSCFLFYLYFLTFIRGGGGGCKSQVLFKCIARIETFILFQSYIQVLLDLPLSRVISKYAHAFEYLYTPSQACR